MITSRFLVVGIRTSYLVLISTTVTRDVRSRNLNHASRSLRVRAPSSSSHKKAQRKEGHPSLKSPQSAGKPSLFRARDFGFPQVRKNNSQGGTDPEKSAEKHGLFLSESTAPPLFLRTRRCSISSAVCKRNNAQGGFLQLPNCLLQSAGQHKHPQFPSSQPVRRISKWRDEPLLAEDWYPTQLLRHPLRQGPYCDLCNPFWVLVPRPSTS
jgi:hypothetical protein